MTMSVFMPLAATYADADLDFVIDEAAPDVRDRNQPRRHIRENDAFRRALIGDEHVFRRVMSDEDVLVRISPALYFEVLVRRAHEELENASHTLERAGSETVTVFDTPGVLELLRRPEVLDYLAGMLASFTKIRSSVTRVPVRKGLWRKVRFNDTDIDSLITMCQTADEERRLALYKRIADVCLFVLGVFPECAPFDYRYPASNEVRPRVSIRSRRGKEEYETEGRRFYRLAGESTPRPGRRSSQRCSGCSTRSSTRPRSPSTS